MSNTVVVIYLARVVSDMGEITLKGYKCERCEHVWVPRDEERPRVCPKCKSPYWDRPRQANMAKKLDRISKARMK